MERFKPGKYRPSLLSVTVAELWHVERQTEHKILDAFFAAIQCVPMTWRLDGKLGKI